MSFMLFQGPGFELEVPTDWLVTSSPEYQAMFLGPKLDLDLRANLMITIRPVQDDVTAGAVAEQARVFQEHEYDDYEVVEEVDFSQNGGLAFLRRFEWFNKDHAKRVYQVQYFFVYSNILFTLTATRYSDSDHQIDALFDHMIKTFRMKFVVKE